MDGRGCYVYVEARDGQITIKQDLNGCRGIYLFRHGDYFALSNSFFRLLDHVKFKYPLTVNRDYCNYFIIGGLCSHAHLETAVNEAKLIERNAIVHIDTAKKNLEIELIDYREHTVPLDSEEGIATLDRWVDFWSNVSRNVAQRTKFFQTALSGGFDTRIALIPLLHSGIDLSNMRIKSTKSELHTYKEDYAIATQIAEHYNLKLNQPFPAQQTALNYSLSDALNMNFYVAQTVHKSLGIVHTRKSIDKIYSLSGYGGEIIRGNWLRFGTLEKFRQREINVKPYSHALAQELSDSVKNILESAFGAIRDKYKIEDPNSLWFAQYLYQETRCKHHFGKFTLGSYLTNEITLSPALDPELRTVRLETPECPDPKLLIALLFARHEPDLLKFPFDSNRSIKPETIAYAQNLNARFPRPLVTNNAKWGGIFNLQSRDLQTEKLLAAGTNNPNIPANLPSTCLKAMFNSSKTYGLFTTYFDAELYHYAAKYYDNHIFNRFNYISAVIGVARVLEDVEISQRNHPPYHDTQRFLEQDFCKIPDDTDTQIVNKFSRYFTARVDIKLVSKGKGDFQIVSTSDDKATVWKPDWFNKDGIGYQIQSYAGKLEIVTKATADGQFLLSLKGLAVRNPEDKSKRIPYWIDYTKLTVNDKTIFDALTPAWHDKPFRHNMNVKAGAEIKISIEWLPHRSDT